MHNRILAIVLLASACACHAGIDTLYRAGTMNGRTLFWLPYETVFPDTLGWDAVEQAVAGRRLSRSANPDASARGLLKKEGYELLRVVKPSAIVVSILHDLGYPVFFLSQWHCSVSEKVVIPKPGLVQHAMRHALVTDYFWETGEKVVTVAPSGTIDDFSIKLYYSNGGYSEYPGKSDVTAGNRQVMGTQGFSLDAGRGSEYREDMNVQRTVSAVYIPVAAGKKPSAVVGEIEKAMDRLKLDLSYTVPKIQVLDK